MTQKIGVSLSLRTTKPTSALLDKGVTPSKGGAVYVKAGAVIAAYDVVGIDELGVAAKLTKAMADASYKIGIATAAFANAEYGWVQVSGVVSNMNVLASCAADAILYTSATAGYLDDDATSQTKIAGIVLTTSRGGTNGDAPAFAAIEPFADR